MKSFCLKRPDAKLSKRSCILLHSTHINGDSMSSPTSKVTGIIRMPFWWSTLGRLLMNSLMSTMTWKKVQTPSEIVLQWIFNDELFNHHSTCMLFSASFLPPAFLVSEFWEETDCGSRDEFIPRICSSWSTSRIVTFNNCRAGSWLRITSMMNRPSHNNSTIVWSGDSFFFFFLEYKI